MDFLMPKFDHLSEEAIITKWLISEGDYIEKGEALLIIETNKASLEIEADTSGVLTKIYYSEGEEVPVLTPIADISQNGC